MNLFDVEKDAKRYY